MLLVPSANGGVDFILVSVVDVLFHSGVAFFWSCFSSGLGDIAGFTASFG